MRQDRVAAYRVVALSRMGLSAEAKAALAEAKTAYGDSDLLREVQAFVETGQANIFPIVSPDDDKRSTIKMALHDLVSLDPPAQAEILSSTAEPFDDYVIGRVREAGAALIGLVPQLRATIDRMNEDDLSAIVRGSFAGADFIHWLVCAGSVKGRLR